MATREEDRWEWINRDSYTTRRNDGADGRKMPEQRTHRGYRSKGEGSPYSITERRVPELIPVLGSQPAGDVSHKPGGRLTLLSARPAVTRATLGGLLPILLLGEQRHNECEQFA